MRLKEKTIDRKIFNSLLAGMALILVLAIVGVYGIFKNVDVGNFYKQEVIAPVPLNDPLKELTDELSKKNIPVNFPLVATNAAVLARMSDGGEVLFSLHKDFATQVDSLQIILSRLKMEGKKIKKIDFRYDRPTVVY